MILNRRKTLAVIYAAAKRKSENFRLEWKLMTSTLTVQSQGGEGGGGGVGEGELPYKSDKGDHRTFYGLQLMVWYPLGC